MKSKVRRLKAEGLIIALEYLANESLNQQIKKNGGKPPKITTLVVKDEDGRFKISNMAALVFALTHPWVEMHTEAGLCDNGEAAHETEYKGMSDIVETVLESRFADDDDTEDEDDD